MGHSIGYFSLYVPIFWPLTGQLDGDNFTLDRFDNTQTVIPLTVETIDTPGNHSEYLIHAHMCAYAHAEIPIALVWQQNKRVAPEPCPLWADKSRVQNHSKQNRWN